MSVLRVCLAIPTFERLGAQRVAIWIARGVDRKRIKPFFLVHQRIGDLAETVPNDVDVIQTDDYCVRIPRMMSLLRLGAYKRALARHPCDVALGVTQYPTLALARVRRHVPAPFRLIGCEHSFVSKNLADRDAYPAAFRAYYKHQLSRIYNRDCDAVVMTAEEGKSDLVERFGVQAARIQVIPNPVDVAEVRRIAVLPLEDRWLPPEIGEPTDPPVIVAAGRLAHQKRFDLLIEAFALMTRRRSARLLILGAGDLEAPLRKQVELHRLGSSVRIENTTPPWQHMARARVFVLSSEWEGFPMVLAEAMALGCSIVSVACPSGPREMLREGRAGLLVRPGDPTALAAGLEEALDAPPREDDARRAAARAYADGYDIARVCERYTELFERVARA